MRNFLLALVTSLFLAAFSWALDLRDAVVRIPSHGASGTVIESKEGLTKILTCAHAFPNEAEFIFDCPWDNVRRKGGTLVKIDHNLDLALVEVKDGPWPVVCPVAAEGFKPGKNLWAVGYPEMKWPISKEPAVIIDQDDAHYFTKRLPIPGESGGGLIDLDAGVIFAVTKARWDPPVGQGCGIYTNLERIVKFDPLDKKNKLLHNAPIPLQFVFPYMSLYPR